MYNLQILDFIIFIFYVILGSVVIFLLREFCKPKIRKILFPGYLVKVVSGFLFVLIYTQYYQGGDTTFYYILSRDFLDFSLENPLKYFRLLFTEFNDLEILRELKFTPNSSIRDDDTWTIIKITSVFNILGLNTYLGTTYFFSLISLITGIYLYKIGTILGILNRKVLFVIACCIPSVCIWGSGILKDTITMFSFVYLTLTFIEIVILKKYSIIKILLAIPISIILTKLKFYIFIGFIVLVISTLFFKILKNEAYKIVFRILSPIILILFIFLTQLSVKVIIGSEKSDEDVIKTVQGFHSWHTKLEGSSYDLNVTDYSTFGIIKKVPEGINVTLFRPYPWEIKTIFMLLSSLEGLIFLYFTLRVLIKTKFNPFSKLNNSDVIIGITIYCLFFSFIVGFTSYNFGALSRFKIPMMPLYMLVIVLILQNIKSRKKSLNKENYNQ